MKTFSQPPQHIKDLFNRIGSELTDNLNKNTAEDPFKSISFLAYQADMKRKEKDQTWIAHTGKAFADHTKCLCEICEEHRG